MATEFNNMTWDGQQWNGYDTNTGQTVQVSAEVMWQAEAALYEQVPASHGFHSAAEMPDDPAIDATYRCCDIEAHSTYHWVENGGR